ncbi:DUF4326 domain-containing protein [Vibrio vulnificus]|uniref:DUF4326 domain-containing protein n=1 Tax=Vibrio vulnificus TaxID=672 RepID=UPI001A249FDF|nr:DUF4326 domain-containing protein [Vibrio vulnificus]HAS6218541.1 DUF4326 domain-containing protein [Vibrio vulnificus]
MKTLLVLYPAVFKAYSKFERKLSRITSNMDDFQIITPEDYNGFAEKFADTHVTKPNFVEAKDWLEYKPTHAVVFDDGEEFYDETNILKSRGIPLREIRISITRVINIKTDPNFKGQIDTPTYSYIGRGSYWGNPYSMHEENQSREEVIRKFKYDFDFEKFPYKDKAEVYKLAGKRLGCFCKPEACHGDVLADFLNAWDDGK